MTDISIKQSIAQQIDELNSRTTFFVIKSKRLNSITSLEQIDSKIVFAKRQFKRNAILSLICGGVLFIGGFTQVFGEGIIDLTRAGLLIILTLGFISQSFYFRIDLERLTSIRFLKKIIDDL